MDQVNGLDLDNQDKLNVLDTLNEVFSDIPREPKCVHIIVKAPVVCGF